MGSLSIQKGKRAERQIATLLNVEIDRVCSNLGVDTTKLKRNLAQTQQGGFDLEGLDWIAIEIKHHAKAQMSSWWDQTLRQAEPIYSLVGNGTTRTGAYRREPVLIWKLNGQKWNVRMFGRLEIEPGRRIRVPVDVSWESFVAWFTRRLEVEIKRSLASTLGGDT